MHTSNFHQANNHLTLCFIIVKITSRFIYFGFLLFFFLFQRCISFVHLPNERKLTNFLFCSQFEFIFHIWLIITSVQMPTFMQMSNYRCGPEKTEFSFFHPLPETKWSIIFYWFQFKFPPSNPHRMQRKQPTIFPTKSLLLWQINEGCWLYFRLGFNLLVAHKTILCA